MRAKSGLPRASDNERASFQSTRSSVVQGGSDGAGSSLANDSSIASSRRFAATGTRLTRVSCRRSAPSCATSAYSDSAGGERPSASVNAATTSSGSIVSLRPGM